MAPVTHHLSPLICRARTVRAQKDRGLMLGQGRPRRHHTFRSTIQPTRKGASSMATDAAAVPKEWRGRFYEDLEEGDVFRSRLGRTITETDNVWFTCLTLNTNQVHFNNVSAEQGLLGKPLVNSAFPLALVTGMTVPDTSENATANLSW